MWFNRAHTSHKHTHHTSTHITQAHTSHEHTHHMSTHITRTHTSHKHTSWTVITMWFNLYFYVRKTGKHSYDVTILLIWEAPHNLLPVRVWKCSKLLHSDNVALKEAGNTLKMKVKKAEQNTEGQDNTWIYSAKIQMELACHPSYFLSCLYFPQNPFPMSSTLRVLKCLSWSGRMWGSWSKGLWRSHNAWTNIWLHFITFS